MAGKPGTSATMTLTILKILDSVSAPLLLGFWQVAYQQRFFGAPEFQIMGLLVMLLFPLCLDVTGGCVFVCNEFAKKN